MTTPTKPRLILGDCLEKMKAIPDGSVDMVLADLPYGTTGHKWDTVIDLPSLWSEYGRVAKVNAAILLFAQCPFDKVLGVSNLRLLRYEWVWEKSSPTGFMNAKRMPLKRTENVLCFYGKLPTYNPQGLTRIDRECRTRIGARELSRITGAIPGKEYVQTHTGYPSNILRYPYDANKYHPTQKPVSLLEYLILTYTNPGETVLDNTMGSGSTIIAALNTGRASIGIEKDLAIFGTAVKRVSARRKELADEVAATDHDASIARQE